MRKEQSKNLAARRRRRAWLILRVGLLAAAIVVVGGAAYLLIPRSPEAPADTEYDLQVTTTMAGFSPSVIAVPAGQPYRLWLKNPDTKYHTDGGGVHGFTVPELGIDVQVQPESGLLVTLPATAAGTYEFYCDTCCGGKENPAMQGVIKIGA